MHQGRSERIKDFPFPRQFATINPLFVKLFCVLLPFGLLREFDKLNESVDGLMKGNMVWLVIPFSVLISWLYTSLEQVGASTESPFEGGANDVPISQMCRAAEIDMRQMLGETDLPPALQPRTTSCSSERKIDLGCEHALPARRPVSTSSRSSSSTRRSWPDGRVRNSHRGPRRRERTAALVSARRHHAYDRNAGIRRDRRQRRGADAVRARVGDPRPGVLVLFRCGRGVARRRADRHGLRRAVGPRLRARRAGLGCSGARRVGRRRPARQHRSRAAFPRACGPPGRGLRRGVRQHARRRIHAARRDRRRPSCRDEAGASRERDVRLAQRLQCGC